MHLSTSGFSGSIPYPYTFVARPRHRCYTRPRAILVTGGKRTMHISVIGTGYVGLVTGACFSEFGVNVTCMDTDATRVARLEKGDVPFYEPRISELVAKGIRENRIRDPRLIEGDIALLKSGDTCRVGI